MGSSFTKLWAKWFGRKEMRILMVGLDAAGKTVITNRLKLGEILHTIPTIGFNVETITYKNINMTIWDVGGQDKIRPLWRHYYQNTQAVIFVVDSADTERLDETEGCQYSAKEELHRMISDSELKGVPLLVLSNKQDLPAALKGETISRRLGLLKLTDRKWQNQECCALTGEGLYTGLDWLSTIVCLKT